LQTITTPKDVTWTINDMALNILAVYADSTPDDKARGRTWYARAQTQCAAVGEDYGVDTRTVVAVVAVLSPMVRWERNVTLARIAIETWQDGAPAIDVPALNNNCHRARRILNGDLDDVERSPKAASFYHSIMGAPSRPCVDRHAYEAATGHPGEGAPMTERTYRLVAEAYREAARDLGMGVRHLQAIVWLTTRRAAYNRVMAARAA